MIELQSIYVHGFFLSMLSLNADFIIRKIGMELKVFYLENAITAVFSNCEKRKTRFLVLLLLLLAIFFVSLSSEHASYQTLSCQTSTVPVEKSAMQFIWFLCVSASLVWLTFLSLVYDFLCFCVTRCCVVIIIIIHGEYLDFSQFNAMHIHPNIATKTCWSVFWWIDYCFCRCC